MLEIGENPRFPLKARNMLVVWVEDDLQCDRLAASAIQRAPDHTHTALADRTLELESVSKEVTGEHRVAEYPGIV
ncbi:hypothetical protein WMF30_00925 [Sorangium sp. So ce134]